MESFRQKQDEKQAVAAATQPGDAPQGSKTQRFGWLFVVSAALHVVVMIALLRSWDSGSAPSKKRVVAPVQNGVEDIQVVRLELAVSSANALEVIEAASANLETGGEPAVHVAVPRGSL